MKMMAIQVGVDMQTFLTIPPYPGLATFSVAPTTTTTDEEQKVEDDDVNDEPFGLTLLSRFVCYLL